MNIIIVDGETKEGCPDKSFLIVSNKWGDLIMRRDAVIYISRTSGDEYYFAWSEIKWAFALFYAGYKREQNAA